METEYPSARKKYIWAAAKAIANTKFMGIAVKKGTLIMSLITKKNGEAKLIYHRFLEKM